MSKGSRRRPEDAGAIARRWPFGPRETLRRAEPFAVDMLDPANWPQEIRDDCLDAVSREVSST